MPVTRKSFFAKLARRRGSDDGGVSLAWRRVWFAEGDPPAGDGDGGGNEQDGEGDGGGNEQDWSSLPEWAREQYQSLQSRLKEVNDESAGRRIEIKSLNERLQALEAKRQEGLTLEERLKEAQAHADGLRQFEERAKTLEARIRESNEQRVQSIPEQQRSLVPVDELSPERLAAWLDKNESFLKKPVAPSLDGGAGSGGGGRDKLPALTDEEKRIARRTGISEEKYAQRKAEIQARKEKRDG